MDFITRGDGRYRTSKTVGSAPRTPPPTGSARAVSPVCNSTGWRTMGRDRGGRSQPDQRRSHCHAHHQEWLPCDTIHWLDRGRRSFVLALHGLRLSAHPCGPNWTHGSPTRGVGWITAVSGIRPTVYGYAHLSPSTFGPVHRRGRTDGKLWLRDGDSVQKSSIRVILLLTTPAAGPHRENQSPTVRLLAALDRAKAERAATGADPRICD